jgi:hypothetical protein
MSRQLQRAAAGLDPYQPVTTEVPGAPPRVITPLDSRRFLDHLEAVSGKSLSALFAAQVLTPADALLLPKRAEARAAYQQLVVAAGDWGTPAPIRQRLSDWDFDGAMPLISEANAWLKQRDALVAKLEAAGLKTPQRLRDRYVESGGGRRSKDELAAEADIASAYATALELANRQRSLIERIGLAAGPEPSARLAAANGRFAAGDLSGAADATARAQRALDGAAMTGWLRVASAIVALAGVVLLLVLIVSRGRRAKEGPVRDD